jgi:hypothetical protein
MGCDNFLSDIYLIVLKNQTSRLAKCILQCRYNLLIEINQIMKAIILTSALAAFGLAALPLQADNPSSKPAVEKAAAPTALVYLVQVSGAG